MSTKGIFIALAIVAAVFGVGSCSAVVGINNSLVSQEAGIKAQYSQNQNNYDNMWKKFREASQVPKQYTKDLKAVYDSAIQNRYGKDGSQAMMQWIKENNPNFDASMYKNLQQMIEAGRDSFEANQTMLLDKKRQYEVDLGVFPNSFVASFLGFPKIDLDKYDIVTSDVTQEAFDSKKANEVNLFE